MKATIKPEQQQANPHQLHFGKLEENSILKGPLFKIFF